MFTFLVFLGLIFVAVTLYWRVGTLEQKVRNLEKSHTSLVTYVNEMASEIPTPVKSTDSSVSSQASTTSTSSPSVVLSSDIPVPEGQSAGAKTSGTPVLSAEASRSSENSEFALGSKVITSVGIVAVLVGVAFFLRYAFETGLITVGMRLFLGVLAGIIMIGAGHMLKGKYDTYGTSLIGGGLGLWYLTSYASFSFYGVISEASAFLLFAIITAIGVVMSIMYNSLPLIRFSLAGGFLVPFIFPLTHSVHVLFPYLIILSLSVLLIARFKVWPELTAFSLVATAFLCFKWTLSSDADLFVVETFSYLTILFVLYFTTSLINFIVRDRDYKGVDAFLVYALPVLYFLWTIPLIETKGGYALLTFSLGIFYIFASLIFRLVFREFKDMKLCSNMMIMIGSAFLAAATAIHFDGNTLIVLWTVEAALMVVVGHLIGAQTNRIVGLVLAVIVTTYAMGVNLSLPDDAMAVFNSRTAILAMITLMFLAIWASYTYLANTVGSANEAGLADKAGANCTDEEKKAGIGLGAAGLFLTPFVWLNMEIINYYDGLIRSVYEVSSLGRISYDDASANTYASTKRIMLSIAWLAYAVVTLTIGISLKAKFVRQIAMVLIAITIFKIFLYDTLSLSDVYRFISFITLGVILLLVGFVYYRFKDRITELVGVEHTDAGEKGTE